MKKFNTAYMSNEKANLGELKVIIENLFTENSEEWICLFDTSKKDYIQVHYDIDILDSINPVIRFITSVLNYNANAIDEKDFYLIEYRKYENENDFKHYRAFFDKEETVISYFEKYINDEEINVEEWIDVTEEFENKSLIRKIKSIFI